MELHLVMRHNSIYRHIDSIWHNSV